MDSGGPWTDDGGEQDAGEALATRSGNFGRFDHMTDLARARRNWNSSYFVPRELLHFPGVYALVLIDHHVVHTHRR